MATDRTDPIGPQNDFDDNVMEGSVPGVNVPPEYESHQLPELSDKKMDATNAALARPLKHAKVIILLVKIWLFSLESQCFLSRVCTTFLP